MERVAAQVTLSNGRLETIEPGFEGDTSRSGSFYRESDAVECVEGCHARTESRLASPQNDPTSGCGPNGMRLTANVPDVSLPANR